MAIADIPSPHPILILVSVLYALHMAALLRPVWTGTPYRVTPLVPLAPTLVWLACLWLLPLADALAQTDVASLAGVAVVPAAIAVADLSWRVRVYTGVACIAVAAVFTLPTPLPASAAAGGVFLTVIAAIHSTMWPVSVIGRLEAAAEVEAQLAVAEERLRMARDLHDTLGRNLAIIALKSELISRTGALEEMEEVQKLARSSQNEIRAVVNAARRPSLLGELEGARSLLRASGIQCTVADVNRVAELPDAIREVLGWAVREAVTNVIRHAAEASTCTICLTSPRPGEVALEVVNNGARPASEQPLASGTGLAGLEQRITPLGGRLEHGPLPRGTYRLFVTLPL
ncbi:sensor histidine kinase [Streptomyces sp. NPDC052236]|uniref:sensor histidine kinase n=1 Tax=Streptomyces sp. NPDC052236 TaxID=3365686 RepID=UPI0037CCF5AB